MNNDNEIPDDINIHKKTWGKNAEEVIYGERGIGDDIEELQREDVTSLVSR